MKGKTKLKALIKWKGNRIVCWCNPETTPDCINRDKCERDIVSHYVYEGLRKCFYQDKYGK